MPRAPRKPLALTKTQAKRIWLAAQRLDTREPFGAGPEATPAAVAHLGYVQIDTINVIERCHHHILYTRIPAYERAHLTRAQSQEKSVFEYWTHALSYLPTQDLRFYLPLMKRRSAEPHRWLGSVTREQVRRVVSRIRKNGALTIRDIDDELVEKTHLWASRKPSKRVLELAFYGGILTISARAGMLKTYELTERHFPWETRPRPASERQITEYLLDRALRSQGIVSLDSACQHDAKAKPAIRALIESRLRRKALVPVALEGAGKTEHWTRPETLDALPEPARPLVHLLSPFDPLVIQRKRLKLFFDYDHIFEAYVPKEKRIYGYFALPVLHGDEIVAAIDLKTDREKRALLIQKWTWLGRGSEAEHKAAVEEELGRFERFQVAT